MPKFLLSLPAELRKEIRIESIKKGYQNMSEYICVILEKRKELDVPDASIQEETDGKI